MQPWVFVHLRHWLLYLGVQCLLHSRELSVSHVWNPEALGRSLRAAVVRRGRIRSVHWGNSLLTASPEHGFAEVLGGGSRMAALSACFLTVQKRSWRSSSARFSPVQVPWGRLSGQWEVLHSANSPGL